MPALQEFDIFVLYNLAAHQLRALGIGHWGLVEYLAVETARHN
jgi:hypothetical protein